MRKEMDNRLPYWTRVALLCLLLLEQSRTAPGVVESSRSLPSVDKGVFVITGVRTCRLGLGYCILGQDCTVDSEFRSDSLQGHCDGLRKAFTPRASFVCCELAVNDTVEEVEPSPPPTTTIIYEERTEISVLESITLLANAEGCGVNKEDNSSSCWTAAVTRRARLNGGAPTDPGSFICTGAIIHPTVILTTSTCIARIHDPEQYQVLYNYKHIPHPSRSPSILEGGRIKRVVVHESYSGVGRGYDVGLILVDASPVNGYCTVCIGGGAQEGCTVSGYSHPNEATDSDGLLHEAQQQILNCSQAGVLCGAGREAAEACFSPRDSGSPLACAQEHGGPFHLRGLFSHGFHCGSAKAPVFYTDANMYSGWIAARLEELLLLE